MRSLGVKLAMALLVLATAFAAIPVLAQPPMLELLVRGRGTRVGVVGATDCTGITAFVAGCQLHTEGTLVATHLGLSTFTVQIRAGNTIVETNADGGICRAANRSDVPLTDQVASLTAANGDMIFFNTVGKLCEELGSGSAFQYIADYRITGGTGRFSDAVGGGSLALTVNRITDEVFLHMHGNIRYAP